MAARTPVEYSSYDAIMARIAEVTGARTQVQLADFLDVRQSSISDAKRRQSVPDAWVLTVHLKTGVMPLWLLMGTGPRTATEAVPVAQAELERELTDMRYALATMRETLERTMVMACMSPEELAEQKRIANARLGQNLRTILDMGDALASAAQAAGMGV